MFPEQHIFEVTCGQECIATGTYFEQGGGGGGWNKTGGGRGWPCDKSDERHYDPKA